MFNCPHTSERDEQRALARLQDQSIISPTHVTMERAFSRTIHFAAHLERTTATERSTWVMSPALWCS
jgi:hypothetical protein